MPQVGILQGTRGGLAQPKKRGKHSAGVETERSGKERNKTSARKRVFGIHSRQETGARGILTDVLVLVVPVLDSNVKKVLSSTSLLCLTSPGTPSHTSVARRPPYSVL